LRPTKQVTLQRLFVVEIRAAVAVLAFLWGVICKNKNKKTMLSTTFLVQSMHI